MRRWRRRSGSHASADVGEPATLPTGGVHRHYAPPGAPFVVDWIGDGSLPQRQASTVWFLAVSSLVTSQLTASRVAFAQAAAAVLVEGICENYDHRRGSGCSTRCPMG